MAGTIVRTVEQLVSPMLSELDLELVDVEFVKEGRNRFLRVFIDSPKGVDLDTCTLISEKLSEALDKNDPIKDAYFLEVSSAGAERPLKKRADFIKSVEKDVHITTYEPFNGAKVFEGKLVEVGDDFIVVAVKNKSKIEHVTLPFDKIASSRLAVLF